MGKNRRTFIKSIAGATAAISFQNTFASAYFEIGKTNNYPVAFFTKPLDDYELPFMMDTLSMAGVDGLDLAVRPKGRVEPKSVAEHLPEVIEMAKKSNLKTEMMVTAITDANDDTTKLVLKTAAALGIRHYRMGYYDYDYKKGITQSLNDVRKKLEALAKLNYEMGIQGGYQNHSGTRVGAPIWDVWHLIKNLPFKSLSSQFDIRHAVAEGASSWVLAMQLLSKNIGSLAIKDFTWNVSGDKAKLVNVPLGEGIVDFNLFFKMIKELGIAAPVTLHAEYPLLSKENEGLPLLQKQQVIVSKLKKDVDFTRAHLVKFQLG